MGASHWTVVGRSRRHEAPSRDNPVGPPRSGELERLPHVRGLVFDLSGVVHDVTHWRHWLWQVLARLGFRGEQAGDSHTPRLPNLAQRAEIR